MSKIDAVILAGGKGTRLAPLTKVLPKPLIPLGDTPIIEIIIKQLKRHKFKHILIATGYLSHLIETYFGNGKSLGIKISYYREKKPLGTAGVLKNIKEVANDFLVINGDTLTNLNYKKLLDQHKKRNCIATISIKERIVKTDFGVISFDEKGYLEDYLEKPSHKSYVSLGINVFNRDCQKFIKRAESIDMPDLLKRMRDKKEAIFCATTTKDWLDLGRIEDLETAQKLWEQKKGKF